MIWYLVLIFVIGFCSWSFLEYAIHNWWGHLAKGKNEFSREHLAHHSKKDYFAPTSKKVAAAASILIPVAVVLSFILGPAIGIVYTVGLTLGYSAYEWLHRRTHTHAPLNFYGAWARKHHFYHHFGNPKVNHGVTSPIWDIVFFTYERPEKVRVPLKMAMRWLLDENGKVKPEYANDYELIIPRSHQNKAEAA